MSTLHDLPLFRNIDPLTSRLGAEHIAPKLGPKCAEFVQRLRERGPSTANEIADGDESIRKRAAQLVKAGYIRKLKDSGVCTVTGRLATKYELAQP
jgi:hypothetical protein